MNASVVVLILANLIPLVGVLFWDWSVFEVVVLYWLENVIIGGIYILKMTFHQRAHRKAATRSASPSL